ncbi:hypothetical protein DSM112329_03060 [Paraconexibacter sp. AEG42_29]|uniref:Methyltransferase type 11 domain-containing protein n=1 Tax=Paraconexibacter sp. AEG42_29 TaxID=2997339 RepID=A0AAU7AX35_9ACTN
MTVDYEQHGRSYARERRPDPRIASRIHAALGAARTVVNVGAGAGSYEPDDRFVLAVEPSETMRAQRPPEHPAIKGRAHRLPLDDNSVDAAMALATVHHWDQLEAGLAELRRVARGPVVVFTFDIDGLPGWQQEFLYEAVTAERARFPSVTTIAEALGGRTRVEGIPTPGNCYDGFVEAFWRRPESLLNPDVRRAQSMWTLLEPGVEQQIVARLADALQSGAWDAAHGHLRAQDGFQGSLRLVVSEPE